MFSASRRSSLLKNAQFRFVGLSFIALLVGLHGTASAQNAPPGNPLWWLPAALSHSQKMHGLFQDPFIATQLSPIIIPSFEALPDPTGFVATNQPGGATFTPINAFFQNLGTNERTCFTCHQPQTAWTVSAASVQQRFVVSLGNDPIFRLVDGATCPSDNVSTVAARVQSFALLLSKGLIRVGLPLPATLQITGINDPYGCSNNSVVNVTSTTGTTAIYSFYRRPLPSTNFSFQTSNSPNPFMWDGREPSLINQSMDATLIHAQAAAPPSQAQQNQMVAFESGIFTAQILDKSALSLVAGSANGGPVALSTEPLTVGAPQPSTATPPLPAPFDIFTAWGSLTGTDPTSEARDSVARGEAIFSSTTAKSCGGCHNAVDNGTHDNAANPGIAKFFNTGLASANSAPPPAGQGLSAAALADIDISALPVFTVTCNDGSNRQGESFTVTDLGRAMITGLCADIGSFKAPSLRGLAARAPYFHNGSAATLADVVNFYNDNFNIGFTAAQMNDLVNFLGTL
jgi:cytochrome c peroxidase